MGFKIYDSNEVTVSLAGRPIESGLADGEFVRIETQDRFTKIVGTDGEVTRSKTNDATAVVTIRLMQTSDANNILSALHNLDLLGKNGAGVGTLLIRDRGGLTIHTADAAWIVKLPDASYDRGATVREWKIDVANLIGFQGGN